MPKSFPPERSPIPCVDSFAFFPPPLGLIGRLNLPYSPNNRLKMQLFVKTAQCTDTVTLNVEPTDTINTVKSMLRRQSCILVDVYYLLVLGEKLLEDGSCTLDECGIKDRDSILLCEVGTFQIVVEPARAWRFIMDVECMDTVRTLKARIHEVTRIPPARQHLYHRGQQLDNDERRLVGYGIVKPPLGPRDLIVLDPDDLQTEADSDDDVSGAMELGEVFASLAQYSTDMQIFVEIPDLHVCIPLKVKPTDTINALKSMIQRPYFIEMEDVLLFGKKLLDHGSSTLVECGIMDQDSLLICRKGCLPIKICSPRNFSLIQDFAIDVECLDTVGRVKEKIQDITGIPSVEQRLKYHGWWLVDDECSLVDYGIVKSSSSDYNLLLISSPSPVRSC